MRRFPVNRLCPLTGVAHNRVLAHIPVSALKHDASYRSNFMELLDLQPEDEFPIVQSPSGFVFAGWELSDDFILKGENEATDHSASVTDTIPYRRGNLQMADAFLRIAAQHYGATSPLKLLDFGCGYGGMLRLMGSRDIVPHGYDMSPAQRKIAAATGATIFDSSDAVAASGPFDLIVFTEVLEHLAHPRAALQFLRSVARPGGLLAITVPNIPIPLVETSLAEFAATGVFPLVFNPLLHLNHFSPETLRQMLQEEGFTVLHDHGRTENARDSCAHFGDVPEPNLLLNAARIAKRVWVTPPSTQLFCRRD